MSYSDDDVMGGSDFTGNDADFDPMEEEMEGMHFEEEDEDPDNDFH